MTRRQYRKPRWRDTHDGERDRLAYFLSQHPHIKSVETEVEIFNPDTGLLYLKPDILVTEELPSVYRSTYYEIKWGHHRGCGREKAMRQAKRWYEMCFEHEYLGEDSMPDFIYWTRHGHERWPAFMFLGGIKH